MTPPDWRLWTREWLLLAALVSGMGYATTPHNPFFTGAALHPYLLVAVLMAARYGSGPGFASAAALTLLYELGGLARAWGRGLPPILEMPHSLLVSSLFLFSLVIGALSDAERGRAARLEAAAREKEERRKLVDTQNQALAAANHELRQRIQEDTNTFQSVYEAAEKLSALEPGFLYPAVLELLENYLKAEQCSFYLVEDGGLRLAAERGWGEVKPEARRVSGKEGVLGSVLRDQKMVTLKDLLYREELRPGDKIMAAPVKNIATNRTIGVIAVEKLPFSQFNAQNIRAFATIADWASKALAKAAVFAQAGAGRAADRKRFLEELLVPLDGRQLPKKLLEQIVGLGPEILPEIGNRLTQPTVSPHRRDNCLKLLEHLSAAGHRLDPEVYRAAARDGLRTWFLLQRYRDSSAASLGDQADLLASYLEERQEALATQASRGLALAGAPGSKPPSVSDILEGKAALDSEFSPLFEALAGRDARQISALGRERFGYEPARFERLIPELLGSPDPWLRAIMIHLAGQARLTTWTAQAQRGANDDNPIVRETSILALARLCPSPDPSLIGAMRARAAEDKYPLVREAAQQALSDWTSSAL